MMKRTMYQTACLATVTVLLLMGGAAGCRDGGSAASGGQAAASPSAALAGSASAQQPTAAPVASTSAQQPATPTPATGATPSTGEPLVFRGMDFADDGRTGWVYGETGPGRGTALWRTGDGGRSWNGTVLPGVTVGGIAARDRDTAWAAGAADCAGREGRWACGKLQLLETRDGGASWSVRWEKPVDHADGYAPGWVTFPGADQGYALIGSTLLTSANGGRDWQPISFDGAGAPFLPERYHFQNAKSGWVFGSLGSGCSADPDKERTAGCAGAVLHTTDGGAHWSRQPLGDPAADARAINFDFTDGRRGWLLLYHPSTLQSMLYRTEDGGSSWQGVHEMRGGRPYTRAVRFADADRGFVALSIGAGPIDGGLLATRDGGRSFEPLPLDGVISVEALKLLPPSGGWMLALDDRLAPRLLRTADRGASWEPVPLPAEWPATAAVR
ncbi:WD40/YVTN/BNR-like repeat-containing protein [Gorillibacterium sp. sgz5001074]|uniref:WD40/YVTN/BNR-like repeat-containing protein n=1 Tax=Gorillibacterium sp. sgz5001074 TaxID=3446695 RepID=UPI003F668A7B